MLQATQNGDVTSERWQVPAARFFSVLLLRQVAGVYYAHPDAWSEMGFGGPASPRGYVRMDADAYDPWEAPPARGREQGDGHD